MFEKGGDALQHVQSKLCGRCPRRWTSKAKADFDAVRLQPLERASGHELALIDPSACFHRRFDHLDGFGHHDLVLQKERFHGGQTFAHERHVKLMAQC